MATDTHQFDRSYFLGRGSNYIFGYHRLRYRFLWSRRLKLVHDLLPTGRLLDVGCAFGYFLELLDGQYETYGLDVSNHAVAQAARSFRDPDRIRQGDAEGPVPFRERFDLVTAFDVMEHLSDPASAFRQFAGALRPGGYLVLEFPTRSTLIDRDRSHHYRPISEWTALLAGAGFEPLQTRGYWTLGLRMVLFPASRRANYYQVVARHSGQA